MLSYGAAENLIKGNIDKFEELCKEFIKIFLLVLYIGKLSGYKVCEDGSLKSSIIEDGHLDKIVFNFMVARNV